MKGDLQFRKEIGERVRNIRNELKMTKEALGKKIGVTGQFIGVIESGKSTMSYDKLKKLCDISGHSSDYILFGKEYNIMNDTKTLLQDFTEEQIQEACEILKKMVNIINKEAI